MLTGPPLTEPADLVGMVGAQADRTPDAMAVASAQARLTWSELDRAVDRWAAVLVDAGLRRGDRVASLMPNRIALLVHYLGCVRAGLVAVPLNYRYVPPQIEHALTVSGARMVFAHAERADDLAGVEGAVELDLGCRWYEDPHDTTTWFDDLPPVPERPRPARPGPDDPAYIFFTSGSTGPAKGVTHSLESTGFMVATAAAAFELTAGDLVLPASSMSHLGSFLWSLAALSVGAEVVLARTFDGDELLPLIREHRPTVMAMVPAALTALVRDHGATAEDFASLRLVRAGSDHVAAELETEFIALTGFPLDEGYGMSEIGLATLNPPSGVIKPGSIGVPVAGMAMSLRDPDDDEVASDTVGRIHVRTPSATIGYWEAPEATRELLRDGWVDTGDLATRDEDGYLWFYGRAKQIIVHDGSNISPQEVEDALSHHPAVGSVGVVGVSDTVHGENVRAYVAVAEQANRPTGQELIRFARERVGYRAPEEVVFLDELPLNPTGKIDRVGLKRLAEAHLDAERPRMTDGSGPTVTAAGR